MINYFAGIDVQINRGCTYYIFDRNKKFVTNGWMKLGFEIFSALKDFPFVYEVFPSASYKMLEKEGVKYELCLNNFVDGAKDMLDASVAAITAYEFINKRGCEVGGKDGLGSIVLPRHL